MSLKLTSLAAPIRGCNIPLGRIKLWTAGSVLAAIYLVELIAAIALAVAS
jgi:hypothetical protein